MHAYIAEDRSSRFPAEYGGFVAWENRNDLRHPLELHGRHEVCVGALCADRDTTGLPVSAAEHRYPSLLRNQVVLSLKFMQQGSLRAI